MIPLCRPSIGQDEFKKIQEVLESGWLTHGPYNEKFEELFAKYIGVGYAQTINSCASALFIVLKAMNITGEVIIPSFTFVATAHAVVLAGAKPVFADVDYASGNITAQIIEPLINDKTEAIIPVHFAGQSCKMDEIVALCQKYKLALIEDSAEAIGATYKNRKTGSFGFGLPNHAGCFSFFPTKNMTTGEGGMITTDNRDLAHKIKILISHGIDKTTSTKFNWQREAVTAGYNLRMSGILAGLGIVQMGKIDEMNNKRREHAKYLSDNLNQEVETPKEEADCRHVYQMYTIKVRPEIRNDLVEELNKNGIGASVHFSPAVHQQEYYKNYSHGDLTNTEKLASSIITLPMFPDLTKNDLDLIIEQVNKATLKFKNKNVMGLIIAGGKGTRMATDIPKPFVRVNDKPIIKYSFDLLDELGIKEQFVSIPAQNNEYFVEEINKINPQAKCIPDNVPIKGNAAGLISAISHIPDHIDQVLILHPDSSCFVSIETIWPALQKHLAQNLVATFSVKEPYLKEASEIKSNEEFEPKSAGIFILEKNWLKEITQLLNIDQVTNEYRIEYLFEQAKKMPLKMSLLSIPSSEYVNINSIDDIPIK